MADLETCSMLLNLLENDSVRVGERKIKTQTLSDRRLAWAMLEVAHRNTLHYGCQIGAIRFQIKPEHAPTYKLTGSSRKGSSLFIRTTEF